MKKQIDIAIRIKEKELIEILKLDADFKLEHVEFFQATRDGEAEIYITGHQPLPEPDKKK